GIGVGLGISLLLQPAAADQQAPAPDERSSDEAVQADRADVERLLEVIDVGPYEVPPLVLKKDHNYAYSATDLEPFRHVTPFREHFLEQMEYTGPGRA
ncbi:MAG: hypothetical protein GTO22_17410, partial [Gemmatimonadales bacterium]|nr:hypothetical protein [Gemmatimonadales bacterium]